MTAFPSPAPSRPRPFRAVPPRIRWLIGLSAPIMVAVGFYTIFVASSLLDEGVSSETVGLLLGVGGLSMVLTAIPLGLFSDRRGRKGLLVAGAAAFPPVLLVFAFTRDPLLMLLAAILSGIAEAAFLSSWNALIAEGTPLEARTAAFSLSFVVTTVAMGAGLALPFGLPALQGVTGIDAAGMRRLFLVALAVASFATPLPIWRILRGHVETLRPGTARGKHKDLGLLLRFSAFNSLIGLGAGFIIPLIPTWLYLKFGVPDAASGPLLALANLTIGLAAVASTALAKRRGPVAAIVTTQGLSTAFMLSLAFVPNPILAGTLYVVRAALMNMASPIMDSYLMSIISAEERGFASALNSLIWRLPNSVSTVAGGIILASGNYELPFFLATGLYAVGISSFYALFRNVKPRV